MPAGLDVDPEYALETLGLRLMAARRSDAVLGVSPRRCRALAPGVTLGRSLLLGANTPKRVRFTRGFGTRAARRAMKSSGGDEYVYWEGMKAFADLEHVSIKLSMLSYSDPNWHQNALVKEAVLRVVELFGIKRCCFASNLPVQGEPGWIPERLYHEFRGLFAGSSEVDQQKLFTDNARRIYCR